MTDRLKVEKEANLYKDLGREELKKVIKGYKRLSFYNHEIFNFIASLLCLIIPHILFFKVTVFSIFLVIVIHYFLMWRFLYKYKNLKFVNDKDKEEIDEIIIILEDNLKNK
jgi:hypothetical protein